MNIVLDAIAGALKAANAILSVIPGLAWAAALAVIFVWGGWNKHTATVATASKVKAEHTRDAAVGEKNQVLAQLDQQKKDAKAKLDQLTAERDAAQAAANEAHRAMEIKDANYAKVNADQAARLRALAAASAGGQLRDPNAAGCRGGGASAQGPVAADPGNRAADRAEAGGLLSAPLSRLLLGDAGESDTINRAYAACRADAVTVRKAVGATP